ncbi:hypothetical protein QTG56_23845 (plasmid) [Rossellomorea sp. AcN35-11]|nr:hypothetical protein [Rossellomorea aquimaris]WJV32395.1 hypothetical protein QTG56_23845 [Rossellomorea sp. AcN35-11]
MSTKLNEGLSEEIQTEMLECQGLKESIMTNSEGTFELFVRNGSLQKAWPVPRKSISSLNDDDDDGIRYSVYTDIVSSIVNTVNIQEEAFKFGYILVSYVGTPEGDELEVLNIRFQEEIHFAREKKRK